MGNELTVAKRIGLASSLVPRWAIYCVKLNYTRVIFLLPRKAKQSNKMPRHINTRSHTHAVTHTNSTHSHTQRRNTYPTYTLRLAHTQRKKEQSKFSKCCNFGLQQKDTHTETDTHMPQPEPQLQSTPRHPPPPPSNPTHCKRNERRKVTDKWAESFGERRNSTAKITKAKNNQIKKEVRKRKKQQNAARKRIRREEPQEQQQKCLSGGSTDSGSSSKRWSCNALYNTQLR